MSYVLTGRALPPGIDCDIDTPCIFCAQMIRHVNEGGTACYAGSIETGKVEHYAYCNDPPCKEIIEDFNTVQSMWFCSCGGTEDDPYVDVIGEKCHECGRSRPDRQLTTQ